MARCRLLKRSAEQVRRATEPEHTGMEVSKELTRDIAEAVERQGHRGFVDVTVESAPEEGQLPAQGDEAELLKQAQPPDTMPAEARAEPTAQRAAGSRQSSRRPS
eukprot:8562353-Alexandrium_andersonii.AAC.1